MRKLSGVLCLALLLGGLSGCAMLFGWDIHAPGILSAEFLRQVQPEPFRVGLYLPEDFKHLESREKGGRFADPQTYHLGEAFYPMLLEAFQQAFSEFVFFEVEPTPAMMRRYDISHLAVVRIKDFGNRVTLSGQALVLTTEVAVWDSALNWVSQFECRGVSDSKRVFAKKGGPEVNLNAAIEQNLLAMVRYLQDNFLLNAWDQESV